MKNRKGITLIALVITVIVLLILAGAAVSIGLNGENVFSKANEAKTEWNVKVAQENEVSNMLGMIDSYITSPEGEIHISNYDELLELANRVNAGDSLEGYMVYLDNDITMPDEDWIVIGTPTSFSMSSM